MNSASLHTLENQLIVLKCQFAEASGERDLMKYQAGQMLKVNKVLRRQAFEQIKARRDFVHLKTELKDLSYEIQDLKQQTAVNRRHARVLSKKISTQKRTNYRTQPMKDMKYAQKRVVSPPCA